MKTESQEQIDFVQWCKRQRKTHPEFLKLFAIPNGGARHIAVASKLKLEGVEPGVPDLFLAVARRGLHGLFIEMKRLKGGVLSKDQIKWKGYVQKEGYGWKRANGFLEAKRIIKSYLKI